MTRAQVLALPLMVSDLILISALSVSSSRESIHGVFAAGLAVAIGYHRGPRLLVESYPPNSRCVHGYSLRYLPVVWGCFGRRGTRSDEYYTAYFHALYSAYNLFPKGPGCLRHTLKGDVEVDK
jgi:hypothetical protein